MAPPSSRSQFYASYDAAKIMQESPPINLWQQRQLQRAQAAQQMRETRSQSVGKERISSSSSADSQRSSKENALAIRISEVNSSKPIMSTLKTQSPGLMPSSIHRDNYFRDKSAQRNRSISSSRRIQPPSRESFDDQNHQREYNRNHLHILHLDQQERDDTSYLTSHQLEENNSDELRDREIHLQQGKDPETSQHSAASSAHDDNTLCERAQSGLRVRHHRAMSAHKERRERIYRRKNLCHPESSSEPIQNLQRRGDNPSSSSTSNFVTVEHFASSPLPKSETRFKIANEPDSEMITHTDTSHNHQRNEEFEVKWNSQNKTNLTGSRQKTRNRPDNGHSEDAKTAGDDSLNEKSCTPSIKDNVVPLPVDKAQVPSFQNAQAFYRRKNQLFINTSEVDGEDDGYDMIAEGESMHETQSFSHAISPSSRDNDNISVVGGQNYSSEFHSNQPSQHQVKVPMQILDGSNEIDVETSSEKGKSIIDSSVTSLIRNANENYLLVNKNVQLKGNGRVDTRTSHDLHDMSVSKKRGYQHQGENRIPVTKHDADCSRIETNQRIRNKNENHEKGNKKQEFAGQIQKQGLSYKKSLNTEGEDVLNEGQPISQNNVEHHHKFIEQSKNANYSLSEETAKRKGNQRIPTGNHDKKEGFLKPGDDTSIKRNIDVKVHSRNISRHETQRPKTPMSPKMEQKSANRRSQHSTVQRQEIYKSQARAHAVSTASPRRQREATKRSSTASEEHVSNGMNYGTSFARTSDTIRYLSSSSEQRRRSSKECNQHPNFNRENGFTKSQNISSQEREVGMISMQETEANPRREWREQSKASLLNHGWNSSMYSRLPLQSIDNSETVTTESSCCSPEVMPSRSECDEYSIHSGENKRLTLELESPCEPSLKSKFPCHNTTKIRVNNAHTKISAVAQQSKSRVTNHEVDELGNIEIVAVSSSEVDEAHISSRMGNTAEMYRSGITYSRTAKLIDTWSRRANVYSCGLSETPLMSNLRGRKSMDDRILRRDVEGSKNATKPSITKISLDDPSNFNVPTPLMSNVRESQKSSDDIPTEFFIEDANQGDVHRGEMKLTKLCPTSDYRTRNDAIDRLRQRIDWRNTKSKSRTQIDPTSQAEVINRTESSEAQVTYFPPTPKVKRGAALDPPSVDLNNTHCDSSHKSSKFDIQRSNSKESVDPPMKDSYRDSKSRSNSPTSSDSSSNMKALQVGREPQEAQHQETAMWDVIPNSKRKKPSRDSEITREPKVKESNSVEIIDNIKELKRPLHNNGKLRMLNSEDPDIDENNSFKKSCDSSELKRTTSDCRSRSQLNKVYQQCEDAIMLGDKSEVSVRERISHDHVFHENDDRSYSFQQVHTLPSGIGPGPARRNIVSKLKSRQKSGCDNPFSGGDSRGYGCRKSNEVFFDQKKSGKSNNLLVNDDSDEHCQRYSIERCLDSSRSSGRYKRSREWIAEENFSMEVLHPSMNHTTFGCLDGGYTVWFSYGNEKPSRSESSWDPPAKIFDSTYIRLADANERAKYLFYWENPYSIEPFQLKLLCDIIGESNMRNCKAFVCRVRGTTESWKVSVVPTEVFEWLDHVHTSRQELTRHFDDDSTIDSSINSMLSTE